MFSGEVISMALSISQESQSWSDWSRCLCLMKSCWILLDETPWE